MDELDFYRRICEVTCQADLEALLGRSLEAAITLSGAEGGHLLLVAGAGPASEPEVHLSRGRPEDPLLSLGIAKRVLETGRALRIENALEVPELCELDSVRRLHILSVLAVPVIHERRAIAALYLASTRIAGIFRPESEAVVAAFAERIAPAVAGALDAARLRRSRDELLTRLSSLESPGGLVGAHPAFLTVVRDALSVAPTDIPVLVLGESGTGKELFARAIHERSVRASGPLVAVNCGAIPESLLESELFGHERGAFTGALARAGRFAAADGGTIFLDEIGELSPTCQVHLLRTLESGEIQRVGSDRVHEVDVRVVAATNRPLKKLISEGRFREDLYYRVSGVTIELPPLRARGEDILLLAGTFLRRFAPSLGREAPSLSDEAAAALMAYAFPGNVRELEHIVRRALVFARGPAIALPDLPAEVRDGAGPVSPVASGAPAPATRSALETEKRAAIARIEREFLTRILGLAGGNVAEAARLADMNRTSLHELLRRHEIDPRRFRG